MTGRNNQAIEIKFRQYGLTLLLLIFWLYIAHAEQTNIGDVRVKLRAFFCDQKLSGCIYQFSLLSFLLNK